MMAHVARAGRTLGTHARTGRGVVQGLPAMVPAAGFAAVAGIGGEFAKQNPMLFGMVFSGTKTTVANLFSQLVLEQKRVSQIDWRQCSVFTCFGVFYMGGVQYLFYVNVLSRLFPNAGAFATKSLREKMVDYRGQLNVLGQVQTQQRAR